MAVEPNCKWVESFPTKWDHFRGNFEILNFETTPYLTGLSNVWATFQRHVAKKKRRLTRILSELQRLKPWFWGSMFRMAFPGFTNKKCQQIWGFRTSNLWGTELVVFSVSLGWALGWLASKRFFVYSKKVGTTQRTKRPVVAANKGL